MAALKSWGRKRMVWSGNYYTTKSQECTTRCIASMLKNMNSLVFIVKKSDCLKFVTFDVGYIQIPL